ncbi:MAG TPA: L,D-transpeptidase family protein, partial [Actinomycetota bacterium]|nr:L,D-transpeptidase family protein [Actinomycetota bacterium]
MPSRDMTAAPARWRRRVLHALQLGLVCVAIGGVAIAGASRSGRTPITTHTFEPPPTPVYTPEPLRTPTPGPTVSPSATAASPGAPALGSAEVQEAERLLSAMGYWTGPVDGVLDAATKHAVMAFQKVEGRARTGSLTAAELEAMRGASRPSPRVGGHRHVEVDLRRQVLFVVETGGSVSKILPVSTGSGKAFTSQGWTRKAVTPRGRFKVTRKIAGLRISPLGQLHWPSYFVGGIAVHGAPSVPGYPASHGCVRVPMFAAQPLFGMMPVGMVVIVHDGGPMVQETDVASPPGMAHPDATVAPS